MVPPKSMIEYTHKLLNFFLNLNFGYLIHTFSSLVEYCKENKGKKKEKVRKLKYFVIQLKLSL